MRSRRSTPWTRFSAPTRLPRHPTDPPSSLAVACRPGNAPAVPSRAPAAPLACPLATGPPREARNAEPSWLCRSCPGRRPVAGGRVGCPARPHTATGVVNSGRPSGPVGPPTPNVCSNKCAPLWTSDTVCLPAGSDVFARTCEDVSLAGGSRGMDASPLAWRDTVEQRNGMAGHGPVDSGRELHGDEVEQALKAPGRDLGGVPA
jgi:hypothetical protein